MIKVSLVLISLVFLSGCTSPRAIENVSVADPVEIAIADGVGRIAAAYEQLALITSSASSERYLAGDYDYDEEVLPEEWLQELPLLEDYHGDLASFVSMLSTMAGLKKPRIDSVGRTEPVIISVNKGSRKLISYMADVGYQAGDDALVVPDVNLNQIIVSFK